MKTQNCCPTCHRAYPKPKGGTPEKKLEQDIAKAQRSIEVLKRAKHDSWSACSPEAFYEAMQSEILRLSIAVNDPRKLWAIYRRADKGIPYRYQAESIAAD
jgi:hypothetical protein